MPRSAIASELNRFQVANDNDIRVPVVAMHSLADDTHRSANVSIQVNSLRRLEHTQHSSVRR